jgi:hypothetical protein
MSRLTYTGNTGNVLSITDSVKLLGVNGKFNVHSVCVQAYEAVSGKTPTAIACITNLNGADVSNSIVSQSGVFPMIPVNFPTKVDIQATANGLTAAPTVDTIGNLYFPNALVAGDVVYVQTIVEYSIDG